MSASCPFSALIPFVWLLLCVATDDLTGACRPSRQRGSSRGQRAAVIQAPAAGVRGQNLQEPGVVCRRGQASALQRLSLRPSPRLACAALLLSLLYRLSLSCIFLLFGADIASSRRRLPYPWLFSAGVCLALVLSRLVL